VTNPTPPIGDLDLIPNGFYAVADPDDAATMTYWHRLRTTRTNGIRPWPASRRYGPPMLLRSDLPADPAEKDAFIAAWSARRLAYRSRIVSTIAADTMAAAHRFAVLETRCLLCGRPLKDPLSKVYGIGPDCREGMDPEGLAAYTTPEIGRAHVQQLAADQDAGEQ
jgi:hypothetical protein